MSTNLAIFLAKLGVFSFTGSKCAASLLWREADPDRHIWQSVDEHPDAAGTLHWLPQDYMLGQARRELRLILQVQCAAGGGAALPG